MRTSGEARREGKDRDRARGGQRARSSRRLPLPRLLRAAGRRVGIDLPEEAPEHRPGGELEVAPDAGRERPPLAGLPEDGGADLPREVGADLRGLGEAPAGDGREEGDRGGGGDGTGGAG